MARRPTHTHAQKGSEEIRIMWRFAALGFQLAAEVVVGLLVGYLLDRWLGTGRLWTAIGGGAGVLLGIVGFVRAGIRLNAQLDREASRGAGHGASRGASRGEWAGREESGRKGPR